MTLFLFSFSDDCFFAVAMKDSILSALGRKREGEYVCVYPYSTSAPFSQFFLFCFAVEDGVFAALLLKALVCVFALRVRRVFNEH